MKDKTQLLAELTLMQEAAKNAKRNGLDCVMFHSNCIAEFAEAAIAELDGSYERAAKVLGNFAQRLKEHWKKSPSLFNTIDKELAQAIVELREAEARAPLEKGKVRITVECGEDVRTFDTSALKMFYLFDGELKGTEYMLEYSEYDECCFYVALKERSAKLNVESKGKFEKIYQKYLEEFKLEEILKGEE